MRKINCIFTKTHTTNSYYSRAQKVSTLRHAAVFVRLHFCTIWCKYSVRCWKCTFEQKYFEGTAVNLHFCETNILLCIPTVIRCIDIAGALTIHYKTVISLSIQYGDTLEMCRFYCLSIQPAIYMEWISISHFKCLKKLSRSVARSFFCCF